MASSKKNSDGKDGRKGGKFPAPTAPTITHTIGTVGLELRELAHILDSRTRLALSKEAVAAVKRSHIEHIA